jgi:hypothetical protein
MNPTMSKLLADEIVQARRIRSTRRLQVRRFGRRSHSRTV